MNVQPSSFIFLLFLVCLPELSEAKRRPGHKPDKARQPPSPPPLTKRNRSVPGSGDLTTKDGHRCTWQTSGKGLVSLLVNCSSETQGHKLRYWCRYAGKPDLCQVYGAKSSQYWKQLVGKLKKRQNACEGEKVLKAKTCKKASAEAHMKLAQHSSDEVTKGGKKKRPQKKKDEEKSTMEERTGFEDGVMNDMAPVQSYCSEGWTSVCSFFVTFFEG